MKNESTLEEFEKMFELVPEVKEEDSQAEEYGNSLDSKEPFEELVSELNDNIKETKNKGTVLKTEDSKTEDAHDIIKEMMSENDGDKKDLKEKDIPNSNSEDKNDEIKESCMEDFDVLIEPKETKDTQDVIESVDEFHNKLKENFDTIVESENNKEQTNKETQKSIESTDLSKDEIKSKSEESKPESEESKPESLNDKEENTIDKVGVENKLITEDGDVKWSLESPSAMYDSFYEQKKRVLESCLAGGQVEYNLWSRELEEAQVNVVTEVFDQQVIINQMEAVQQFRNRVKYLGVRINNQYFLFDRFVPLLRGYLARIQYLKPVLKQEGLILEHMGDIEMYFERLRGLHKSVADTEKNLAAAYDMLSRKVTICMELPPVERRGKPESKTDKYEHYGIKNNIETPQSHPQSANLSDFDNLPLGATAGAEEKKSGATGWDTL